MEGKNETIETKSLMRISKFALQINKSAAWVRKLGEDGKVDLVEIDGFWFIRVNERFHEFLKS
jgi:hypothetical protein